MPDIAYDPTAAGLADGSDWVNAVTTLQGALTAAGNGGRVFARNSNGANEETYVADTTINLVSQGTIYSPVLCYAVQNTTTAFPPLVSDLITDANDSEVSVFNNFSGGSGANIYLRNYIVFKGFKFLAGGHFGINSQNSKVILNNSIVNWGASTFLTRYMQASDVNSYLVLNDCLLDSVERGDKIYVNASGMLEINKCWTTGTGFSGNLVENPSTAEGFVYLNDNDFRSLTSLTAVFSAGARGVFGGMVNCALWPGWSLTTGSINVTEEFSAIQCNSLSNNSVPVLAHRSESYLGSVIEDITLVRDGDLGDGVTPFSYKLTPRASGPTEGLLPLYSPWVTLRVSTTDTQIEAYIYNSGSDKNNAEVWLEVLSPNETAGASIATRNNSSTRASDLSTPVNLADDTTTWNGSANFAQKISLAITPDTDGIAHVRYAYAMRSSAPDDLYVSPEPVVT